MEAGPTCWECDNCGWQVLDPQISLEDAVCLCGVGAGRWRVSTARAAKPVPVLTALRAKEVRDELCPVADLSREKPGGTLVLSWGAWGGFYWRRGAATRLCLGWLAVTYVRRDLDFLLEDVTQRFDDVARELLFLAAIEGMRCLSRGGKGCVFRAVEAARPDIAKEWSELGDWDAHDLLRKHFPEPE